MVKHVKKCENCKMVKLIICKKKNQKKKKKKKKLKR